MYCTTTMWVEYRHLYYCRLGPPRQQTRLPAWDGTSLEQPQDDGSTLTPRRKAT